MVDDVHRLAGALGVGLGLGLDRLGCILGLVRREVRRRSPITSDVVLAGGHAAIVQHGDLAPRRARAPGQARVSDDLGLAVDEGEAEDHVGLVVAHALEDGAACRADLVVGARAGVGNLYVEEARRRAHDLEIEALAEVGDEGRAKILNCPAA